MRGLIFVFLLISFSALSQNITYKGVIISFEPTVVVPKSWNLTVDVCEENQSKMIEIVETEIDKYPSDILKNLKKVYVFTAIKLSGSLIGGTFYKDTLYLKVGKEETMKIKFHHELFHLLYSKHKTLLNINSWEQSCEKNESSSGLTAIKNNTSSVSYSTVYYKKGYMYEYATSCLDEDMASIAEHLFVNSPQFEYAINNFDKIKSKSDLMKQFYKKISPNVSFN